MQGYILKVSRVKDEDSIVEILTPNRLIRCYRFYGARHSNITQGYKLDFELEHSMNFLPRLMSTIHLGFSWLLERERLFFWQQFMRLYYAHLREAEDLDGIYFDILDEAANKFQKQNPKRVILESYVKILAHEGRRHLDKFCFLCDDFIEGRVAVGRGFLPAHERCLHTAGFDFEKILELYKTKKSINLDDDEVDRLYFVILEGF